MQEKLCYSYAIKNERVSIPVSEKEWGQMKETLKKVKADVILSAVLCVALGIVLIVWSEETIQVICKGIAAGLIIMGAVYLMGYIRNREMHPFSGVLGAIVLLVGIWIFLKPESVVSLVPIVIGVILVVHGIQDLKLAMEIKQNSYQKWWSILIMALISLALGILCIVHAFGIVKMALMFIGVALIYDGLSDLWIVSRAAKAAKKKKQEEDALDVEYKEL